LQVEETYSEHVKCTTNTDSVYYNIIRKEQKIQTKSEDVKYEEDMSFLPHMSKKAKDINVTVLLMRWFSTEIQDIIKLLCSKKHWIRI
jgi:hypothetical protein